MEIEITDLRRFLKALVPVYLSDVDEEDIDQYDLKEFFCQLEPACALAIGGINSFRDLKLECAKLDNKYVNGHNSIKKFLQDIRKYPSDSNSIQIKWQTFNALLCFVFYKPFEAEGSIEEPHTIESLQKILTYVGFKETSEGKIKKYNKSLKEILEPYNILHTSSNTPFHSVFFNCEIKVVRDEDEKKYVWRVTPSILDNNKSDNDSYYEKLKNEHSHIGFHARFTIPITEAIERNITCTRDGHKDTFLESKNYTLRDLIDSDADLYITCEAGSGKTTLLKSMLYDAISSNNQRCLPFFVELKNVTSGIQSYVESIIERFNIPASDLEAKKVLFIFDALDEYYTHEYEPLHDILELQETYGARVILTSRFRISDSIRLGVVTFKLESFSVDDVTKLLGKAFDLESLDPATISSIQSQEYLRNPLNLYLAIIQMKLVQAKNADENTNEGRFLFTNIIKNRAQLMHTIIIEEFLFEYESKFLLPKESIGKWKYKVATEIKKLAHYTFKTFIESQNPHLNIDDHKLIMQWIDSTIEVDAKTFDLFEKHSIIRFSENGIQFVLNEYRLLFIALHMKPQLKDTWDCARVYHDLEYCLDFDDLSAIADYVADLIDLSNKAFERPNLVWSMKNVNLSRACIYNTIFRLKVLKNRSEEKHLVEYVLVKGLCLRILNDLTRKLHAGEYADSELETIFHCCEILLVEAAHLEVDQEGAYLLDLILVLTMYSNHDYVKRSPIISNTIRYAINPSYKGVTLSEELKLEFVLHFFFNFRTKFAPILQKKYTFPSLHNVAYQLLHENPNLIFESVLKTDSDYIENLTVAKGVVAALHAFADRPDRPHEELSEHSQITLLGAFVKIMETDLLEEKTEIRPIFEPHMLLESIGIFLRENSHKKFLFGSSNFLNEKMSDSPQEGNRYTDFFLLVLCERDYFHVINQYIEWGIDFTDNSIKHLFYKVKKHTDKPNCPSYTECLEKIKHILTLENVSEKSKKLLRKNAKNYEIELDN